MFDNEPNPQSQVPVPPAQPSPISDEIHTMPERFLDGAITSQPGGGAAPSGKSSIRKVLIVVLIVVVVGGLGVGAWYYFTKLANKNVNGNLNTNTRGNANTRVNTNLNRNGNLNLNTNAVSNVNGTTNANQNTNSSVVTTGDPLPGSTDGDSDGLTNVEEAVYGTSPTSSDTDGDGFIDGMRTTAGGKIEGEVYLGYCPTQKGAVKLDDSACNAVRTFSNSTYNYALWIPKNWLAQSTDTTDQTVIVTPDLATSEYFQITVRDNPTQLTAKSYYVSLNSGVDQTKVKDVSVNGLDGVMSLDQSTVYFVKGTKIYEIRYDTGALTSANLRTTYFVMERSFHLVSGTTTNTNSSINTNSSLNTNSSSQNNSNAAPIIGQ